MGIYEETNKVTTLERGGSDTHAVWIACALGAKRAYIYSDTPLKEANPGIVPNARVIDRVTYGEMAEIISYGAEILSERANEAAEESLLELVLRSTNKKNPGETVVSSRINGGYSGIKCIGAKPSVVLALSNLPDVPGAYNQVTEILNRYQIGFMNEAGDLKHSSMVVVGSPDNPLEINIGRVLRDISELGLGVSLHYDTTRIGLIGEGIGRQPKGLAAIGETLDTLGLPMNMISSPMNGIALSIITDQTHVSGVVRGLYDKVFKG
jgi:aspartate kinase